MVIINMELNNKKIMIIKTITIFLSLFLFSFGYNIFPNFFTTLIFPVNESLFEHLRMIYNTEIIISLIIYIILKIKKYNIHNYIFALLICTIFNIILFYLIYMFIYNRYCSNLIITMTLYFITLSISQYLFYLICLKPNNQFYNNICLIIIPVIWVMLLFWTYNPPHTKFFFDPIKEIYGIPLKK